MKIDISVIDKESGAEITVQDVEGMAMFCKQAQETRCIKGGRFNWLEVLEGCLKQGMPKSALNVMDAIW